MTSYYVRVVGANHETGWVPRVATATVVYQVLQRHLATFLERLHAEEAGPRWPGFVL